MHSSAMRLIAFTALCILPALTSANFVAIGNNGDANAVKHLAQDATTTGMTVLKGAVDDRLKTASGGSKMASQVAAVAASPSVDGHKTGDLPMHMMRSAPLESSKEADTHNVLTDTLAAVSSSISSRTVSQSNDPTSQMSPLTSLMGVSMGKKRSLMEEAKSRSVVEDASEKRDYVLPGFEILPGQGPKASKFVNDLKTSATDKLSTVYKEQPVIRSDEERDAEKRNVVLPGFEVLPGYGPKASKAVNDIKTGLTDSLHTIYQKQPVIRSESVVEHGKMQRRRSIAAQ